MCQNGWIFEGVIKLSISWVNDNPHDLSRSSSNKTGNCDDAWGKGKIIKYFKDVTKKKIWTNISANRKSEVFWIGYFLIHFPQAWMIAGFRLKYLCSVN